MRIGAVNKHFLFLHCWRKLMVYASSGWVYPLFLKSLEVNSKIKFPMNFTLIFWVTTFSQ